MGVRNGSILNRFCSVLLWIGLACTVLFAQQEAKQPPDAPAAAEAGAPSDPITMFPHSDQTRWYLAGQLNSILQMHQAFYAAYSGHNSLRATAEAANSIVATLYTGYELTHTTEVFFDLESSGGYGISNALGLAGFTNLDVVRNPSLGPTPYLARLNIRQIIPLSHETIEEERDYLHLAMQVP